MIVSDNDLYDISEILKIFRINICHEYNCDILDAIIEYLEHPNNEEYSDNSIRILLSEIVNQNDLYYEFAFEYNYYVHRSFLKDSQVYKIIISYLKHLKLLIENNKLDQAMDFVDAVHVLPEILVYHHFKIPRSYWRIYLKPYKKKYKINTFS